MNMRVAIIEDESGAQQHLKSQLLKIDANITVTASLSSIRESINYFEQRPEIDLVLMDIELSDGQSFEILERTTIDSPIIFITGHQEHTLKAFKLNSIDYLLKPVDKEELQRALMKYHKLKKSPVDQFIPGRLLRSLDAPAKKRIVVKQENESITLRLDEVVLFYTENKNTFVIDSFGRKYLVDKNLSDLEDILDPTIFFRANRQYIVNINFIRSFKSYQKVKILVNLTLPKLNHSIIISQDTAPQFREWMNKA
jgi:DNA-binding LytR/AlgR family response regulator